MNGLGLAAALSLKNGLTVHSVHEEAFRTYGRVVTGYDFSPLLSYMEKYTAIPEEGNTYIPSVPELEQFPTAKQLEIQLYGGIPIQIGYCNGRNTTYNGFEYHKCSEINIAVSDFMLVLGHVWDIRDNTIRTEQAQVFFVEKGTAIEMYQTTLHLSPCRVSDEGYRDIVVLTRGTNTPLVEKAQNSDPESALLLQRNKWVIAHPDQEPLICQGAFPGLIGENRELCY